MASTAGGEAMEATTRDTVFALPELFEAILLELPWKDILKVTGVCKHWNTTIKKSPQIRKKLHAPTKSADAAKPHDLAVGLPYQVPVYSHHIKLNPYLSARSLAPGITSATLANNPIQGLDKLIFQLKSEMPAITGYSSCLAMHLTDPPCTTMVFTPIGLAAAVDDIPNAIFTIHEPDGITYGQAIEKITKVWRTTELRLRLTRYSSWSRPELNYQGVVYAQRVGDEKKSGS
jgi:hypothetical protein